MLLRQIPLKKKEMLKDILLLFTLFQPYLHPQRAKS